MSDHNGTTRLSTGSQVPTAAANNRNSNAHLPVDSGQLGVRNSFHAEGPGILNQNQLEDQVTDYQDAQSQNDGRQQRQLGVSAENAMEIAASIHRVESGNNFTRTSVPNSSDKFNNVISKQISSSHPITQNEKKTYADPRSRASLAKNILEGTVPMPMATNNMLPTPNLQPPIPVLQISSHQNPNQQRISTTTPGNSPPPIVAPRGERGDPGPRNSNSYNNQVNQVQQNNNNNTTMSLIPMSDLIGTPLDQKSLSKESAGVGNNVQQLQPEQTLHKHHLGVGGMNHQVDIAGNGVQYPGPSSSGLQVYGNVLDQHQPENQYLVNNNNNQIQSIQDVSQWNINSQNMNNVTA